MKQTLSINTVSHYRAMLDALPQAVCIIGNDLSLRDRNATFIKMFGETPSTCHKLLFGRDEPCPCCLFSRVQETGEPAIREVRTEINGSPRYFRISATPLTGKKKNSVSKILYSIEDITSRAVAEKTIGDYNTMLETTARETIQRLEASERKFRNLIEHSRDMFLVCQKNGMISMANDAFFKLTGYTAPLSGLNLFNLFSTENAGIVASFLARSGTDETDMLEAEMLRADQNSIWVELTAAPQDDGSVQLSARDITRRRMLEEQSQILNARLQHAQQITIASLARLAEYRDGETGTHLERIVHYTEVLARQLALNPKYSDYISESYISDLTRSCLLHDIGKVGIPDQILRKPARLTDAEYEVMKRHTLFGGDTLAEAERKVEGRSYLNLGKEIAYYHHEHWDGSGYPSGLKGEEIPLSARIVAVADVYDALTSHRPYKEPYSHDRAVDIICQEAGTHFDSDVVQAFLECANQFRELIAPSPAVQAMEIRPNSTEKSPSDPDSIIA